MNKELLEQIILYKDYGNYFGLFLSDKFKDLTASEQALIHNSTNEISCNANMMATKENVKSVRDKIIKHLTS